MLTKLGGSNRYSFSGPSNTQPISLTLAAEVLGEWHSRYAREGMYTAREVAPNAKDGAVIGHKVWKRGE